MEPQHGSAFLVLAVLTLCYLLLSCLPEPQSTLHAKGADRHKSAAVAAAKGLSEDSLDLTNVETKKRMLETLKNSCLPKLVCQLLANNDRKLSRSEMSLLSVIKDTSLGMTAEVTSKLHFAAHMGQLVAGVDGTGCHNFYPACPLPGNAVLPFLQTVKRSYSGKF
ncbi:uncharacterized protein LOC132199280 [Neocloeon triangulifer]|uniref:uncharacterized protein LOC132199280 n=1 Tax=Neocloeon triangulifer TaxID=2078957 RepID=UPI00286F5BAF|nr:uncharacterized protein LOC132199280 [Neocloeon triangulifer]